MIKKYLDNFKNFPKEIWILTLITFINRAGTMVVPFLSKYMKENLEFSYSQIGWVMVFFGAGSILGTWLSGKLSDKIGFYKVMVFSLFTSGIVFILLQYATTFEELCVTNKFLRYKPTCPAGGIYTLGALEERVNCSLADKGHKLE